jgi:hypothetical protein
MAPPKADNGGMSTKYPTADLPFADAIPPDIMADVQLVAECVSAGRPIPPEVVRRVRERGERITEDLRQKYGLFDIGVPAIRELRGELPE